MPKLTARSRARENIVVRGARVLDPVEGIDQTMDVRVDCGVVAQLGERLDTNEHHVVDGRGMVLAPAFVDPHVHLRTPGREDEETIATGTAAAAAGGYCAVLAMPNTDPVIDSAAVLESLVERARAEAEIPVGFLAAISKGQEGAELTEMAELADRGAVAFTDDGRPVASAGLMRRALQYSAVTGRKLALHCEEPTLSRSLAPTLKMNPPLRAAEDRAALVDALRDGTIQAIATDHAPHARHEKEVPFEAAPFGVTGLETAFAVLYTELVKPGHVSLETLLA